MCLYIFHLLISYLDQRCGRGPDHEGICYKVQDLKSGLSSWGPKRRQPGHHVPPPASHQHLLPLSICRCSLWNTTTSPTSSRSGQLFVRNSSLPLRLRGQARVDVAGLVSPTGLPAAFLRPASPSALTVRPACFQYCISVFPNGVTL